MVHWIVKNHGIYGERCVCSNCGYEWIDLYSLSNPEEYFECPECHEKINKDKER